MKKILVVDDNPDIGRLLEVTLAGSYEVVVATDGVSGAQAVSDHRPDAVLLDHMLPGQMQGLQVLQNIKTDPLQKHILVAMITARGQAVDQRLGFAIGADAYFVKPFSPQGVLSWLKERLA
jgi:DNA-binding response OmpR family regulator